MDVLELIDILFDKGLLYFLACVFGLIVFSYILGPFLDKGVKKIIKKYRKSVIVIFVLFVSAVLAVKEFVPRKTYCINYSMKNGIPVPVERISKSKAKKMYDLYCIEEKGIDFGPMNTIKYTVKYVNWNGKVKPNSETDIYGRPVYFQIERKDNNLVYKILSVKGKLIKQIEFADEYLTYALIIHDNDYDEVADDKSNTFNLYDKKVYGIEFSYTEDGCVNQIIYKNIFGKPAFDDIEKSGIRYEYTSNGLISSIQYLTYDSYDGYSVKPMEEDVYKKSFSYIGNVVSCIEYLDLNGDSANNKNGYAMLSYKYSDMHNIIATEYRDKNNEYAEVVESSASTSKEYAFKDKKCTVTVNYLETGTSEIKRTAVFKHDKDGNLTEKNYLDNTGNLTLCTDSKGITYAKLINAFDKEGNLASVSYYGTNNEPIMIESGYHKVINERDENGNLTCQSYYGINDEPVLYKDSSGSIFFKAEWTYNENGSWMSTAHFGVNGEPVMFKDGYHKIVNERDDNEYLLSQSYYGINNEPVLYQDSDGSSFFKKIWTRDENGNWLSQFYYGINNEPIMIEAGYHKVVNEIDDNENIISQSFYGINGEPILYEDRDGNTFFKILWTRDEKGNSLSVSYYGINNEPKMVESGYSYGVFTRDFNGNITSASYYDTRGKLTPIKDSNGKTYAKYEETYDSNGNYLSISFFGINNEPIMIEAGYFKIVLTRDSNGNVTSCIYYDDNENPVLITDSDGDTFAMFKKEFDRLGNLLSESYYDEKLQPVMLKSGYHKQVMVRDSDGKVLERSFYDKENHLALYTDSNKNQYARIEKKYNLNGNEIYTAYYDENNKPTLFKNDNGETYAIYEKTYDVNGYLISELYYDQNGKPKVISTGYSGYTSVKDDRGNILSCSYFGEEGKPVLYTDSNGNSYAKYEKTYDEKGGWLSECFYGIDNEPIMIEDGYHKLISERDDKGNIISQSFFGKKGEAILYTDSNGNKFFKTVLEYDENGNWMSITYFGVNNEPIMIEDGYSSTSVIRNSDGNIICQGYFSADGKPVLRTNSDGNSYAKYEKTYDDYGNCLSESFYGIDNEPIMLESGYHKVVNKTDENENITSQSFYGINGEPVLYKNHDGNTFFKIVWTRDEKGNWLSEAYYGVNNEPIISKYGYHKIVVERDNEGNIVNTCRYGIDDELIK